MELFSKHEATTPSFTPSSEEEISGDDKRKEIICLIGNTRSGLSTTRLLLCGSEDNFENLDIKGEPSYISDGNKEIGDYTGSSCTIEPKVFSLSAFGNVTLVDTPGRGDTRGYRQEIGKLKMLTSVINQAKRLKVVLLVPYKYFYNDSSRNEQIYPLLYANEIMQRLSDISAFGLVVTMVDNNCKTEEQDNCAVITRILSKLELLTSGSSLQKLLKSVINNKSVFIIRRPDPPQLLEDKSSPERFYIYSDLSQKFAKFCDKLTFASRLETILVKPSVETEIYLLSVYYPHLVREIEDLVAQVLIEFENCVEKKLSAAQPEQLQRLLTVYNDALNYLKSSMSDECTNWCSTNVLDSIRIKLSLPVNAEVFQKLKAFEDEIFEVQSSTGVKVGTLPGHHNISLFSIRLEFLIKTLETIPATVAEASQCASSEFQNIVDNLDILYTERFKTWCANPAFWDLAANKVEVHIATTRKLFVSYGTNGGNLHDFLLSCFATLELPCLEALQKEIENLSQKYYFQNTNPDLKDFEKLVIEILEKNQDQNNNQSLQKRKLKIEEKVTELLDTVKEATLTNGFYKYLSTNNFTDRLADLLKFQNCIATYIEKQTSEVDTSKSLAEYIQEFCKMLSSKGIINKKIYFVFDHQLYGSIEEMCVSIWFEKLEALLARLRIMSWWYTEMANLRRKLKELNVEGFKHLKSGFLPYSTWKSRTENLLWPNDTDRVITDLPFSALEMFSSPKFMVESEFCENIVFEVFNLKIDRVGNSLLIMRDRDIYFSEFVNAIKARKDYNQIKNIFIVAGREILVDQSWIDKKATLKNLVMFSKIIKFSGYHKICFEAMPFVGMKDDNERMNENGTSTNIFLFVNEKIVRGHGKCLKLVSTGSSDSEVQNVHHIRLSEKIYVEKINQLEDEFAAMLKEWHVQVGSLNSARNIKKDCHKEDSLPFLLCAENIKTWCFASRAIYKLLNIFATNSLNKLRDYCFCGAFVNYEEFVKGRLHQNINQCEHRYITTKFCSVTGHLYKMKNAILATVKQTEFDEDCEYIQSGKLAKFLENSDPTLPQCLKILVHINARIAWLTGSIFKTKFHGKLWTREDCDNEINSLPENVKQLVFEHIKSYISAEDLSENNSAYNYESCPGKLEIFLGDCNLKNDQDKEGIYCFRHHILPCDSKFTKGDAGFSLRNSTCAGYCESSHTEDIVKASVLYLLNTLSGSERQDLISLLLSNAWCVKNIFTVDLLATDFLKIVTESMSDSNITKCTKTLEVDKKYEENLRKFQTVLIKENEAKSVEIILSLLCTKRLSYQQQALVNVRIFNLKADLEICTTLLKNLKKSQLRSLLLDHHKRFVTNLCLQKNEITNTFQGGILREIQLAIVWFERATKSCGRDLDGYVQLIKKKYFLDKVLALVDAVDRTVRLFRLAQIIPPHVYGVAAGIAGAVTIGLNQASTSFVKPKCVTKLSFQDFQRFKIENEEMLETQIEILQNTCTETQLKTLELEHVVDYLKNLLNESKELKKLKLPFLQKLSDQQHEMFQFILNKRYSTADKDLQDFLQTLYIDLMMTETDAQLYSETKKTVFGKLKEFYEGGEGTAAAKLSKARFQSNLIPVINQLLKFLSDSVDKQNENGLDNWSLKSLLIGCKHHFATYVRGLPSERDFNLVFEKLELALDMRIDMWDKIEKYEQTKQIVNYITGTTLYKEPFENIHFDRSELRSTIAKIYFLTKSQILLLNYFEIQKAFLQWAFPYAEKYMSVIPHQIELTKVSNENGNFTAAEIESTKNLAKSCTENIEYFRSMYAFGASRNLPEDRDWTQHNFDSEPHNRPFYIWPNVNFAEDIRHLFLGKPTKFLADIDCVKLPKTCLKTNNTVDLRFVTSSFYRKEFQNELDTAMKQFVLEMTHSGVSHYKIGKSRYVITGEQIHLTGNVDSKSLPDTGEMLKKTANDTRRKMSDFVLSPYTEWTFKLSLLHPDKSQDQQEIFTKFADMFAHSVNIELIGRGKYINDSVDEWKEPENLETYYEQYKN